MGVDNEDDEKRTRVVLARLGKANEEISKAPECKECLDLAFADKKASKGAIYATFCFNKEDANKVGDCVYVTYAANIVAESYIHDVVKKKRGSKPDPKEHLCYQKVSL